MKTYKMTDKNGKCFDQLFEVGKTYTIDGEIKACHRGYHSCKDPMDCLNFKDIYDGRFFECDSRGDVIEAENKVCCSEINIADIDYSDSSQVATSGDSSQVATSGDSSQVAASGDSSQVATSGDSSQVAASGDSSKVAASGDSSKVATSGDSSQVATSGDSSKVATSGDSSKVAASGDSSKVAASGDSSKVATSGYYSQVAASGYSSQVATSGDSSQVATSGDSSKVATSGDSSKVATSGDSSIACGIGYMSKCSVSDKDSWIVIADYKDGKVVSVVSKKPGMKIGKVVIKVNTYYWFEDGELRQEAA